MLYFDENNLRTLKIEKNAFTSYGIKLVQRYPKLFKQHYTFNTDVSKEFKYFDFFIVCVTMLNKHFKKTIKYILINQTLIDMYYAEKITLTDLSEKHFMYNNRKILVVYDNDMTKKLLNEMLNCLTQRVDLSNSNYLKAVYQFEYACYEFLSQKSNTCLLKFDFSITCLINNKKLIKENSYIILSKKNNTMYISKLTYEACFILTRIGKQFAEKLENDIFQDINEFIK